MSPTTTKFDLAALIAAVEADDPAGQAAAYAQDAVIEIQNRDHGPADPLQVLCRYPEGSSVICSTAFDVQDGQITRETRPASVSENVHWWPVGSSAWYCRYHRVRSLARGRRAALVSHVAEDDRPVAEAELRPVVLADPYALGEPECRVASDGRPLGGR